VTQWWAPFALRPDGWARDVSLDVDAAGIIVSVEAGTARVGTCLQGAVVPAMPNLHSHAFQRALAGRTGKSAPGRDDSFWTWRQAMYAFLDRVDGEAFEAIAAQAYVEMVKSGYGAVAEFHYVHHDPAGRPYADAAELAWRLVAAARTAELDEVVAMARPGAPVHIHAAEQTREVDDCFAWSGMRPVEWLLAKAHVDARWCIVHATHMTERETAGLAASGAVAGLALTTEADLGDGVFPGSAFLHAGGRFGVGSDSNTMISPFAELRQFEWSQRLRARRRNVLSHVDDTTIGTALWSRATAGGAQAVARRTGAIAPGMRADLVVLDTDHPALAEQRCEDLLDAAIFGTAASPVRDVLVGGERVVTAGRHRDEDAVFARYRAAMVRLRSSA